MITTLDLPQRAAPRPAPSAPRVRTYQAAEFSRLLEDVYAPLLSANRAMEAGIRSIRARAQFLERNDPLVRKLRRILAKNVVGPTGFALQVSLGDREQNQAIESSWWRYANSRHVHAGRRMTLSQLLTMAVIRRKLDGEVFLVRTHRSDSPYRICWQLLEADQCPIELNRAATRTQREIRYGIELDEHGAPATYHFLKAHPSEGGSRTQPVPAEAVIHAANLDRPGQVRGVPEIAAAIVMLAHLGGYREAELVAARMGANTPLLLKPDPTVYQAKARDEGDLQALVPTGSAPGEWNVVPVGTEPFVPPLNHPNSGYGEFVKDITRSIAASWDVSYHTLAADLEGANMSSARVGELADRDGWITQQEETVADFQAPIFAAWAEMAVLTGHLKLKASQVDALLEVSTWQGRRWKGVDPLKDMKALAIELQQGLQSRTAACAEMGRDFTEIMYQRQREQEIADELGVTLPSAADMTATAAAAAASPDSTDTGDSNDSADQPARRLRTVA